MSTGYFHTELLNPNDFSSYTRVSSVVNKPWKDHTIEVYTQSLLAEAETSNFKARIFIEGGTKFTRTENLDITTFPSLRKPPECTKYGA